MHPLNILMNRLPAKHNAMITRTMHRAAQAGVILLVYYFILIGGFAAGMREHSWRMVTLILLSLVLGGWFLWRVLNHIEVPSTGLGYPLLAMLGVSALAALFSTDPRLSIGRLSLNLILAISLYFTLDWMRSEWRTQLLVQAILVTGGVVCLIGFVELRQWYVGTWNSPVSWREAGTAWTLIRSIRIKSALHSANGLAYFLILIAGLTFYKLSLTKTNRQRLVWGAYLLMVMMVMMLTQSRGGLLGMIATIVTFGVLFLWSRTGKAQVKARASLRWGAVVAVLVIVTFILLIPVIMRTDLSSIGTFAQRDKLWEGAIRIFLAHPVAGAGPDTFPTQYMRYRNQPRTDTIFAHAHMAWLDIAAEYGIAGLLSVGYFWITLGILILSYLRRHERGKWSRQLLSGVSILAGQGVHNLTDDFINYLPTFTWLTVLAITFCLLPICDQRFPFSSGRQRIWSVLVGAGIVVVLGSTFWFGRAFAAYDRARQLAQDGHWPQAASELERAVELDPAYRFYRQQLALAYGELTRKDSRYLPLALAQQELAYEQSNSYPPDAAYLACLYWESGHAERAIELMRTAVSISAPEPGPYYSYHLGRATFDFNLGRYLEAIGEAGPARQAYAQVLLAFPQVGTSSYWQVTNDRRERLEASAKLAQQLADDKNLAAEIALYSGDRQKALQLFATPPIDQVGQAKSLLAMGQMESARDLLASGSLQSNAKSFPYRAQTLAANGNFAQAETNLRRAIARAHEEPSRLLELPSYYYYWGRLSELRGESSLAEEHYEQAVAISTAIETIYANLVGHRQPLPTEQPFCLMIPYPAENLSKPSLALAELMVTEDDPAGAMNVYQNLLRHEPYNRDAQQGLAELLARYPNLASESPTDPGP